MKTLQEISESIRDVIDFPKEGIIFKDITPILHSAELFDSTIDHLIEAVKDKEIDIICGIESRGFLFGAAMAVKMGKGIVLIRKPGKLPYKTFKEEYALEYGSDSIEIHQDALKQGDNVLLVDDLLATGGTASASVKLIEKCGANAAKILFVIELGFLEGIKKLVGYDVKSLITY
jgi:adenine phosphoribosyltransferase